MTDFEQIEAENELLKQKLVESVMRVNDLELPPRFEINSWKKKNDTFEVNIYIFGMELTTTISCDILEEFIEGEELNLYETEKGTMRYVKASIWLDENEPEVIEQYLKHKLKCTTLSYYRPNSLLQEDSMNYIRRMFDDETPVLKERWIIASKKRGLPIEFIQQLEKDSTI